MKVTGPCATPDTIEHPAHPDGGPWPFFMVHGDKATWADTRTELISALIDGYEDLPETPEGFEAAFDLRYAQAITLASDVQASMMAHAVESGAVDLGDLTSTPVGDEQFQALLTERTIPFDPRGTVLDTGDGPVWDCEIPLVLIATDYAPFSGRPLPTGRVAFVDPSTETAYLDSLQAFGRVLVLSLQDA